MQIETTPIKDCHLLTPSIFEDKRGLFFESYHEQKFEKVFGSIHFVQDNISVSKKGTLRGLHFQKGDHAQAKLVSVIKGAAQDVVVDLRRDSFSYGKYFTTILDDQKRQQIFMPRGVAHGFLALTNEVIFAYKCDNYYNNSSESGIIFNDTDLNINWEISANDLIVSEKDLSLPKFCQL